MSEISARHLWFYVLMAIAAVGAFAFIVIFGSRGHLWVLFTPIILMPVSLLVIRVTMEFGKPSDLFNPSNQSWAFLYGAWLFLPAALATAAYGWQTYEIRDNHFFRSIIWLLSAIVIGLTSAYLWRTLHEVPRYHDSRNSELLSSPSKLWHDYVVYPALVGGIFYMGFPVIIFEFKWLGVLILSALVSWAVLGLSPHDSKLNPRHLHPPVSETLLARR